jgi:hypothetical protein
MKMQTKALVFGIMAAAMTSHAALAENEWQGDAKDAENQGKPGQPGDRVRTAYGFDRPCVTRRQ